MKYKEYTRKNVQEKIKKITNKWYFVCSPKSCLADINPFEVFVVYNIHCIPMWEVDMTQKRVCMLTLESGFKCFLLMFGAGINAITRRNRRE